MSGFESRKGELHCNPEELFGFVTDMRHFRQFVPEGRLDSLKLEQESCSFSVPAVGEVNVKLAEKMPFKRVIYTGNAMRDNEFTLRLEILPSGSGNAEAQLFLDAELNPFLKMMASGPINSFLETLMTEMEKFRGWKDVK
jgi:carbon monoxide dehydrogenase subunit G